MYDLSSSSFLKSSISQKEQFSNGAILKWSISRMEQFSNQTFLKWSNSQMEHFGVATLCHISRPQEQRNMACDVLSHFCLLRLRVLVTSSDKQKYWLHHDSHLLKCGHHIVVGAAHSGYQIVGTS